MGWRAVIGAVLGGGAIVLSGGCTAKEGEHDLVAGKAKFAERCAACHQLARAQATGVQGPNLDEAFRQALEDGMGRDGIQGAVLEQIKNPARLDKDDPAYMPPNLVKGEAAQDVAAYVAASVAKRGEDEGRLAEAVKKPGGGKPIAAENGAVEIAAAPTGLAYESSAITAEAGPLKMTMPNPADLPHNIALEGGGINEIGPVVNKDGTSEIDVEVKAGEYTFFCSVPGHREGGMEGKLTVR